MVTGLECVKPNYVVFNVTSLIAQFKYHSHSVGLITKVNDDLDHKTEPGYMMSVTMVTTRSSAITVEPLPKFYVHLVEH